MSGLFRKLNFKEQGAVMVLNAPEGIEGELETLTGVTVHRTRGAAKRVEFLMVFAVTQRELDAAAKVAATNTDGDAVVWVAYPKKSSKRYACEFDRDQGWDAFGDAGFEGVRMVAVDEDWSALRLRRVEFIKTMKRASKRAMTKKGKARTR